MKKILLLAGLFLNSFSLGKIAMQEITPGFYKHSKSGKPYEVVSVARYSENPQQQFVVYKQLYASELREDKTPLPIGTVWIRPLTMFTELVEVNGKQVPRFIKTDS